MKPILVTGGTGTLGRVVVERLLDTGREVRVASRRAQPVDRSTPYQWVTVDYRSGAGMDPAMANVDVIIHCATGIGGGDVEAAGNLIRAAQAVSTPHLVYISIVGVDRVPFGYYRDKWETERLIESSELPWTILRTTQFHDLVVVVAALLAWLPAIVVPADTSVQPDVGEVADRLVELALGPPAGRVPDMGGPQVRGASDVVRAYLRAGGRHRLVIPVRFPGRIFAAFRQGGHLAPGGMAGRVTFEEFLRGQAPSPLGRYQLATKLMTGWSAALLPRRPRGRSHRSHKEVSR